jgi:hypothetical protein
MTPQMHRFLLYSLCVVLSRPPVSAASQESDAITCYGVNGLTYANQIQCSGSKACCGVGAECQDNRLCKQVNSTKLIRGPCLTQVYNFDECAQVCVFSAWLPFP